MSETASAWSSTVYGLLVHPAASRVHVKERSSVTLR